MDEIEFINIETQFVFRYKDGHKETMGLGELQHVKQDITNIFIGAVKQPQSDEVLLKWKAILLFPGSPLAYDAEEILDFLAHHRCAKLLNILGPIWMNKSDNFSLPFLHRLFQTMFLHSDEFWRFTCLLFVETLFSGETEEKSFIRALYLDFIKTNNVEIITWMQQNCKFYLDSLDKYLVIDNLRLEGFHIHDWLKILEFHDPEHCYHLTIDQITKHPKLLFLLTSKTPLPNVIVDFHAWDLFHEDLFGLLSHLIQHTPSFMHSLVKLLENHFYSLGTTLQQRKQCASRMLYRLLPFETSSKIIPHILQISSQMQDAWLNVCDRCGHWTAKDFENIIKLSWNLDPHIFTVIKKSTRNIPYMHTYYYFPVMFENGFELKNDVGHHVNARKIHLTHQINVFSRALFRTIDRFVSTGMINQILNTTRVFAIWDM